MNGTNWDRCKEYVKSVWLELTKALEEISDEEVAWLGLELAEKARDIWENGTIALTKFKIVDKDKETEGMTLAIIRDNTPTMPAIIITPRALFTKENLLRTLLHELIHAAGFIGENEEEDEVLTEYLTDLIMDKLMELQRIQNIPSPPPCTPPNTTVNAGNVVTYLSKNPDKYVIINEKTLKDYIHKIRDLKEWEKGLVKPMKELLTTLNEISDLCEALKKVYHNKTLKDINNVELRERMKTIIAGGLSREKNPEKALAPLLWKLFGIEITSSIDNTKINKTDKIGGFISTLENEGINYVTVTIRGGMLCSVVSRFKNVLGSYLRSLGIVEYRSGMTVKQDETNYEELIVKYIPKPGDKPVELNGLLSDMFNQIYKLIPGVNPFTTFVIAFSPAYLDDLFELLGINSRTVSHEDINILEKVIRLMGFGKVITPKSLYESHHITRPQILIEKLRSEDKQDILKYSDQILLIHYLELTGHSGIIDMVRVILSNEYNGLEELLLRKQSGTGPYNLSSKYLLAYLNDIVTKIAGRKHESDKKSSSGIIECTIQHLLCEQTCFITTEHLDPPYTMLRIVNNIPRDILYSPALVLYVKDIISTSKRGYQYVNTHLERMKIPHEDSVLRNFCSRG